MTDPHTTRRMMDELAYEIIRLQTMCKFVSISTQRINREFHKQSTKYLRLLWQLHFVGSMQEGFPAVAISDGNMMMCNTTFPIVLWNSPEKENGTFVIAEQDSKHPVYSRLKAVDKECLDQDFRSIINQNGYLKNSNFIKVSFSNSNYISTNMQDYIDYNVDTRQGPSITGKINSVLNDGTTCTTDAVPCLKCQSWPPFTSDFFTRKRQNNWPSRQLLDNVKGLECHVVPVGYPGSESFDTEWRLSFSIAERELIPEMHEPYHECMFALKSIKKNYLEYDSHSDKPTPFCSYFIKTACLWMCETFPHTGYSVMDLIRKVLDWLIDCYQHKHLPHYFIPQHNLIGHLPKECCDNVVEKLVSLQRGLWTKVLLSVVSDNWRFIFKICREEDGCSILETTLLNRPDVKAIIEVTCYHLRLMFPFQTKLMMAENAAYNYPLYADLSALDMQKNALEISSHLEKVTLSIVENIEKIVPKGYREMYKTSLYRYLGDIYTHFCSTNKGCDEALALYQNKLLHYYNLGAKMVFPGHYSDYGIGGKILLVKYHYIMGNYKEVKQMCDTILLLSDSCLRKENCILASLHIIKPEIRTTVSFYGAWAVDDIFLYLVKNFDKIKLSCYPIILVLYLKARVLLIEGDTENALNLVKKMKECNRAYCYDTTKIFITIIESLVGLLGVMRIIFRK